MTSAQLDDFQKQLKNIKVFIYQNVNRENFNTKEILERLPADCIKLSIPSLFFNAYNPEVTYIRESREKIVYHDRLQLKLINNYSLFEQVLLNDQNFYPKSFSQNCYALSINELKNRELNQNISVPISDYIEEKYREERLFHVLNHPSQSLIKVLSERILHRIGLPAKVDSSIPSYYLDKWQFPIYKSHFDNLELKFENSGFYFWDGIVNSPKVFFEKQRDYYSKLSKELLSEQAFSFAPPMLRTWDLAAEFDFQKID